VANILAFTAEQVCKLTGLTKRQLRYWDDTGFFSPTTIDEFRGRLFGRIYSFRDVVGLRVIGDLRRAHGVPLQELRKIGGWLAEHYDAPWSALRFALSGRRVVFVDPVTGVPREAHDGKQAVMEVTLEPIANDVKAAADKLSERRKEDVGRIVRNRYVVHNTWVVAGTRISTTSIWNFHRAGFDARSIVDEYPRLTAKDVRAAVKFEEQLRKAA
jgi:DNA-binding transcriptional MerR regulator